MRAPTQASLSRTILRSVVVTMLPALMCAGHGAEPAQAQSPSATAIFIAIPETFPDIDARAMVVREPGRDVIVLDPDEVTADALAMSLLVLARVRTLHPAPARGQIVPITGFVVDAPPSGRHLGRLESALSRLRDEPTSDLGTLGAGRWIRYRAGEASVLRR